MAKKSKKTSKSEKRPIFWLSGNYHECQMAWKKISTGKLPAKIVEIHDPNIIVIEAGHNVEGSASELRVCGAGDIIRLLKSRDIFDKRQRIIKVKGIPPDYKILTDYLTLVNKNNILVIDSQVGYRAKPPAKQWISVANTNLVKKIKEIGYFLNSPMKAKNKSSARQWLKNTAEDFGKMIDDPAAALLVERVGLELDILYGHVLTLVDYSDNKITKEDVEVICSPLFLETVWDLINNIIMQRYDKAMSYMQKFYQNAGLETGTTFMGDVQKLFGALHHYFMFLIMARDYLEGAKKKNPKAPYKTYKNFAAAVNGMIKMSPTGDRWKHKWQSSGTPGTPVFNTSFIQFKLKDDNMDHALHKWTRQNTYEACNEIGKCHLWSRKKSNESDIKMCLDSLIMTLCGKIKPESAELLREGYSCEQFT